MAFTVQDFRSRLQFGGARQNQFQVLMPFPAVSGGTSKSELFTFMAKGSSIPGEEVGIIRVPYFGRTITVPGDRVFQEWTIKVINDEDFGIRDVFEQWSNAINGHFSNLRDGAAKLTQGYQIDATVMQYGKTGDVIKEYDMIGCWPASVSPIELGWDQNDQIEEFDVTFAYQWWESRTTV